MADGAEERITRLETAFESTLPHLATKADIARLETHFESTLLATKTTFDSTLPHLATKADIARLESKMMLWVFTMLACFAAIIVKLFT